MTKTLNESEKMKITTFMTAAMLVIGMTATAQTIDFECQSPTCTYVFPPPPGSDCEGVSGTGVGTATVSASNGAGFPTSGSQFLRVIGAGQLDHVIGTPPTAVPGVNSVMVAIPGDTLEVTLDWSFYSEESLTLDFVDGVMIDFIDSSSTQLGVMVFAEAMDTSMFTSTADTGPCGTGTTSELLPTGAKVTTAEVPVGAAFLRISSWNRSDDNFPSHIVVDNIRFVTGLSFENQVSCDNAIFPFGLGATGDVDGISTNVIPGAISGQTASVDAIPNTVGFPTRGNQYLRLSGTRRFDHAPGEAPTALPSDVAQVYLPVPLGATSVSMDWELFGEDGSFVDGGMIDVIDAFGRQIHVLEFADGTEPKGSLSDSNGCLSNGRAELGRTVGPEVLTDAPLPGDAAYIRFSTWNFGDQVGPPHLVVDRIIFSTAPSANPRPGTGEDLYLSTRIDQRNVGGFINTVPVGEGFGFNVRSTTFAGAEVVMLGQIAASCPAPVIPPAFPGLNVDNFAPGLFLISASVLGSQLLLPLDGLSLDFGPNTFLAGGCFTIQAIVPTPLASNGIFVSTDSHELRFD